MDVPDALVFDLDGTLTPSKGAMSLEMGDALSMLLTRMPVAIMSGGWFPQFEKQLLPYVPTTTVRENLYLFPASASSCYVFRDGSWNAVYMQTLSTEERARVLRAFDEALIETAFEKPATVWGERIEDRGSQITFSALGQEAPVEAKRVFDPDRKKRTPLQEALARRLPDFSVRVNAYSSIDVTKMGMNKAYGIRRFSEMLSAMPIVRMLYVGDALFVGGNDEIVLETGIPTHSVSNPLETLAFIRQVLAEGAR